MVIQKSQLVRQRPQVGDYVLILTQPPGHSYMKPCTLGRVTKIPPTPYERILSVDLVDPEGDVMGIGIDPSEVKLRRIDERVLAEKRLPPSMDKELLNQYETLKRK